VEKWKVKLEGDNAHLKRLSSLFCSAELGIREEGEHFYLAASNFESLDNPAEVRAKAIQLLRLMNGLEKFNFGEAQAVKAGDIHGHDKDGKRFIQVETKGSLKFMVPRVKLRDGKLVASWDDTSEAEQREVVQHLMRLALANDQIGKAFRVLESHELDWNALYKLFEIVQSEAGDAVFENGWVNKSKISLFKHTANSYGAIAERARHVGEKVEAPVKPMTQEAAEDLIMDILSKWICSKS
jgi:hypothetical protein